MTLVKTSVELILYQFLQPITFPVQPHNEQNETEYQCAWNDAKMNDCEP